MYVNTSGDGLDSNGNLVITGGEIYVDGPTNYGNGALGYGVQGCSATISWGTVVAAGASGMAVGFGDNSSQCSLLIFFGSTVSGGTAVTVTDADENTVLTYTPFKDYQCAVLSNPNLKDGSSYTVTAGGNSKEVTLSGVSTSSGTRKSSGGVGGEAQRRKSPLRQRSEQRGLRFHSASRWPRRWISTLRKYGPWKQKR